MGLLRYGMPPPTGDLVTNSGADIGLSKVAGFDHTLTQLLASCECGLTAVVAS